MRGPVSTVVDSDLGVAPSRTTREQIIERACKRALGAPKASFRPSRSPHDLISKTNSELAIVDDRVADDVASGFLSYEGNVGPQNTTALF